MKAAIVGTGYVGLVSGVVFADAGIKTICVDNDQAKLKMLRSGKSPIFEPGLEEMMQRVEEKGFLKHETVKGKYIYYPTIPLQKAARAALNQVLETFFKGSEARAVISILKKADASLTDEDAQRILDLIEKSREEGM